MVHNCPTREYNNLSCPEEGIAPQRSEGYNQDDILAKAIASPSKVLLIVYEDYLIIFRNHADLISASPEMPPAASSGIDRLGDRKERFFFHHPNPQMISRGRYTGDTLLAATWLFPHGRESPEPLQNQNISQLKKNGGVISDCHDPISLKYAHPEDEVQTDPLLPNISADLLDNAVPPVPTGITCGTA